MIAPTKRISSTRWYTFLRKPKFVDQILFEAATMLSETCTRCEQSKGKMLRTNHTAVAYPLTAPAVMPSTKYFCTNAKRMMTGIVVIVPSAMMMPQSMCVELM